MTLDEKLLAEALKARDLSNEAQYEAARHELAYHHLIRRLHAAGGSLREIAQALNVSHQRVHQIVDVGAGKGVLKDRKSRRGAALLRCSFCAKDSDQVAKLIAGPGVYICNECLVLANGIIGKPDRKPPTKAQLSLKCSFCGKGRPQVEALVTGPGMYICNECVNLCNEIIAEEMGTPKPTV
jgi:hypothetical protein